MEKYFNINYEFSPQEVWRRIDEQLSKNEADYICVADGVILNNANRKPDYLKIVNGGMFAICDSGDMYRSTSSGSMERGIRSIAEARFSKTWSAPRNIGCSLWEPTREHSMG